VIGALLIDAVLGDPPNKVHPLRWVGNAVSWLDGRIKRKSGRGTKLKGFLAYVLVALVFLFASFLITALARECLGEAAWMIATAVILKLTFAVFSFRKHCGPIRKDLMNGRTEDASEKTQMIVSRDTDGMDAGRISSSCTETVSENFADSVCSPLFYTGVFGMAGAVMFRTANMMDAMWGYRNERYGDLGYFAAKFDDVLGYATSRISAVFVVIASALTGYDARSAWRTAMHENKKTPSPNSGWPMAAAAGALGITMIKDGVYEIGSGRIPDADDISRCCRLVEIASVLFILLITMPLYMSVGVHVQISIENAILELIGVFA